MRTPGGGGYDPAAARSPERVARDVRRGYYTGEQARERFQVCLSPETGEVDAAATAALRDAGSADRADPGEAGPTALRDADADPGRAGPTAIAALRKSRGGNGVFHP